MNEVRPYHDRLKGAVASESAPPFLESRVRAQIAGSRRGLPPRLKLVPLVLGLAACVLLGSEGIRSWSARRWNEGYIAAVTARVSPLLAVGLGDHIHCAYFRRYPAQPPTIENLDSQIGSRYRSLIPIVRANVPANYKLMLAHQCNYHGRKFIHLSLKNDTHLMSVVITRKLQSGDSFAAQGLLPELAQSGIPMYQGASQFFTITAFENPEDLVYFVSDLSPQQNSEMMLAMAPAVRRALAEKL